MPLSPRQHVRPLLRALACALIPGLLVSMPALGATPARSTEPASLKPDAMVERIIELTKQGQSDVALKLAQDLNLRYPNFRLGQLLLGDLLSARYRPIGEVGDVSIGSKNSSVASTLTQLRQEFSLRTQAATFTPREGELPANLLRIGSDIPSVVLVDTSRSRLYLFKRNRQGTLGLVRDYYFTQGLLGDNKSIEGDKRTPLGIYLTTGRIPQERLGALYGAGALPLNYPNPVDMRHGKTGSGIWIHGVPFSTYARLPRESDGCIALANDDLVELREQIVPFQTPVIITNGTQWLSPSSLETFRREFLTTWDAWQRSLGQPEVRRLFYDASVSETWAASLQLVSAKVGSRKPPPLGQPTMLYSRNGEEQIMVRFSPPGMSGFIRQYWLKQDGIWKIVSEQRLGAGVSEEQVAAVAGSAR